MFASFNPVDVFRLAVYRHIFVNYTDTAFASHGDSKPGFGYGVHSGGHKRDIKRYIIAETGGKICHVGSKRRSSRNEQHVVVSERFFYDFIHKPLLWLVFAIFFHTVVAQFIDRNKISADFSYIGVFVT